LEIDHGLCRLVPDSRADFVEILGVWSGSAFASAGHVKAPNHLLLGSLLFVACASEAGGGSTMSTTTTGSNLPACSPFPATTVAGCLYADDGSGRPSGPVSGMVTEVVPTSKACMRQDGFEVVGPEAPAHHVHLIDAASGKGYWVGFALPGYAPQIALGETVTAELRLIGGDIIPPNMVLELSRPSGLIAYVGEALSGKIHLPGGLDYELGERYCADEPGECQLVAHQLVVGGTPVPIDGAMNVGGYRVIDGGARLHVDSGQCDSGNAIRIGVLPAP
jgi:hypothetical protein